MICLRKPAAVNDGTVHEIWKKRLFTDLWVHCEGHTVGVHKALFASSSLYLDRLFCSLQRLCDSVLILDGFRFSDVENLIRLLYEGEVYVSREDVEFLKELMKALEMEKVISAVNFSLDIPGTPLNDICHGEAANQNRIGCRSYGQNPGSSNLDQECSFFDDSSISHVEVVDHVTDDNNGKPIMSEKQEEDGIDGLRAMECEEHVEEIGDIVIKTRRSCSENPRSTKYVCDRCNQMFATGEMLEAHALMHKAANETDGSDVQCTLCLEVFPTVEQRNVHTKVFHEELTCQICNVVLSAKRMKGHMKQEHDIVESHDGKVTYCCLCKKTFSKAQYQAHYARMHVRSKERRDSAPTQCPYCNKTFSIAHINYHIRLNHSAIPVFNCNQCKKIFKTKESRDEHKDFCYKATTVCNVCNEMYRPVYRKAHLMRHAREECANIGADEEGRFRCPRCDRKFEHRFFVENHMFGHLWPRCKYECSGCASMFILKKQVDAHVEKCEEEINAALRRFASRPSRTVVRSAWTPEERLLGKVCTVCSKRVKSSAWASHMNNHQKVSGELTEQFSCDACDKFFFRKSDVEKHIALKHRNDGKKVCSKCKKLFSSSRELELHRSNCKKVYTKMCPVCGHEIDLFQRINHLKAHAEQEIENCDNLACPRCERTCENSECLINHLLNHYEPFREFECDLCLLGFKTRIILQKHKAVCNGPEVKSGPAKKRHLSVGVKKKQVDDILQWKCPACLALFDTEQECSDHIHQIHEAENVEDEDDEIMSVFT